MMAAIWAVQMQVPGKEMRLRRQGHGPAGVEARRNEREGRLEGPGQSCKSCALQPARYEAGASRVTWPG